MIMPGMTDSMTAIPGDLLGGNMPYDFWTTKIKGTTSYCMRSKVTGKKYCYKSKADRDKAVRIHEAMWAKSHPGEK